MLMQEFSYKIIDSIVFFLAAVIFLYNFARILKVFMTRRKNTGFALMILFLACVGINISSGLDGLFYNESWGYEFWGMDNLRYGYAISLIFTAMGIVSLVYFATEIFSSGSTTKFIKIIRVAYATALCIAAVWGMIISLQPLAAGESGESATSVPLMVLFLLAITLYIVLAFRAFNLAKKVDDAVFKKSIKYIGFFSLLNLGLYVTFIMDAVTPGQDGTSYWSLIGTLVFLLAAYLAYLGFVKPMSEK